MVARAVLHLLWVVVKVALVRKPIAIYKAAPVVARRVVLHLLWAVVKVVVLVRIMVIVDVRNNVVGSGCVLKMEKIMYMVFLAVVGNGSALLFHQMALKLALVRVLMIVNGACPALPIWRHRLRNVSGIWIAKIQTMMNAGR